MNTRKSNDKPTDAPAVAETESVLSKADQYVTTLQETHISIPQTLAEEMRLSGEWGNAAITGTDVDQLHAGLSAARERREGDARRRRTAIEGLLELEPELVRARASADQDRSQLAATVVTEFHARWQRACHELAELHAEAAALSAALHARVDCPPPYMAAMSVVHEKPEVRFIGPAGPVQPVTLPPALATVAGALDKLDSVLAMVGGIKQARQLDSRSYHLALQRHTPTERGGVYRVIAEFTCPADGLPFKAGELVDGSLVGQGHLQRLTAGKRYIQPVELEIAAA
jgi:hypothetical protein